MIRLFIKILLLIFCNISFSQTAKKDSSAILELEKSIEHAKSYFKSDLDSALLVLKRIEPQIKIVDDPNLTAKALLAKARFFLYKKEYASIIDILGPNIEKKEEIDPLLIGRTYRNIGNTYRQQWVPDSALVNYIRALRIFETAKSNRDLSLTYLELGIVYSKLGNDELKEVFYNKSIRFSTNSAVIEKHKNLIFDSTEPDRYDHTIEFSQDIVKIAEAQNNDRLLVIAYRDLMSDYYEIGKLDLALKFAEKELKIIERTSANALLANTKHTIGQIYIEKGRPDLAIVNFSEALTAASDSLKLSIYSDLKDQYVKIGNLPKAIEALENYTNLKDSVNSRKIEASITEITEKYQSELREEQIKNLNSENKLNTAKISAQRFTLAGTIIGSILLMTLGFLGFKNHRAKQELNYSQLNFKLLQTQLNPHFMFNALNEIKLSLNNSNTEKSSQYLSGYSKLMRLILDGSTTEFVSISEDVSLISEYLQLQQLVSGNTFNFNVLVDDDLDLNYLQLPPMLTQPFVENAVLHGIKNVSEGQIDVSYKLDGDSIIICITDNGRGFSKEKIYSGNEMHTSLGTSIIKQRITTYQKLHNFKIEIGTVSNQEKGTNVEIKFPQKIKTV